MKNFALGLTLGLLVGMAGTALAVSCSGGDDYLKGWEVIVKGKKACTDPYIRVTSKEIECVG